MKLAPLVLLTVVTLGSPVRGEVNCTTDGQVTDCQSPQNLAPTQPVGCVTLGETTAAMTPPDLALSVLSCRDQGRLRDQTELFTLLMMRGYFDAYRVTDATAHQALTVLRMQLGERLGAKDDQALMADLQRLIADKESEGLKDFCARLLALPLPDYEPVYMIEHGMNAVIGTADTAPVKEVDAMAVWKSVVSVGLQCPKVD